MVACLAPTMQHLLKNCRESKTLNILIIGCLEIIVRTLSNIIIREQNNKSCLDLIFAVHPCEKLISASDENYIISAIRKFMLDMPRPGSFQNIDLYF